jgi:DNA-binding MarR family transcriptional regulator
MKSTRPSSSTNAVPDKGARVFYTAADVQARNTIGLLMKRCVGVLLRNVEHRMRELDLAGSQWIPLLHVAHGFDTPASCAREMQVGAAAVTRMFDRLEAKGLVQRERSKTDRRVVRLALTHEGLAVMERVPDIVAETLNQHLQDFAPEELQTLVALVGRFVARGEAIAQADGRSSGVPSKAADLDEHLL